MGRVGGLQRRHRIRLLGAGGRGILDQEPPDLAPELFAPHEVGQGRERIRAHARAFDEGGDHGRRRQGLQAEDAGVKHGGIGGVGADEVAALARREPGRGGEMIDRAREALGVDRERGPHRRGQAGHQSGMLGGGLTEEQLDAITMRYFHPRHVKPPRASAPLLIACLAVFAVGARATAGVTRAAAGFGPAVSLTPTGGAQSPPQLAVAPSGRILATWLGGGGAVFARFGSTARGFGPAHVLGRPGPPEFGGLVAGIGADGTAAVAWGVDTIHGGTVVSIAPPGGRFGPPRLVSGHDELVTLVGVGIDGTGRVVVVWRKPFGACCDNYRVRYAMADRGHAFTAPRTLPHSNGGAQLITTPTGKMIISGDASASVRVLSPGQTIFATTPVLATGASPTLVEAAAGPGGVGAALEDTFSPDPNSASAGVGAVRASASGVWGPPLLVDARGRVIDNAPSLAVPGDGATVLTWGMAPETPQGAGVTIGFPNVEVAIAEPGGAFEAPVELAPHALDSFGAPEIAAFGSETAIAWSQRGRGQDLVRAAVRPALSAFTPARTLGRAGRATAIAMAAGGTTAVTGWLSHGQVRVAIASERQRATSR
jgi:hypothetical protein